MNSTIPELVKKIIAEQLEIKIDKVRDNSLLREDLEMDSFDAVELVFQLENLLKIKIPQDEFYNFKKVTDITAYINKNLSKNN